MELLLAEMIDRGVVEVIGQWDDGEPDLRVADLGLPILSRMDEADQARFRPVIDAQFCGNPGCRRRIRPGWHYVRVMISTDSADVARADPADGMMWSGIFCTRGCAQSQTDFVFMNYDAFIAPPAGDDR
jgi:hypothetical protein